jgi:hypothetical protein
MKVMAVALKIIVLPDCRSQEQLMKLVMIYKGLKSWE